MHRGVDDLVLGDGHAVTQDDGSPPSAGWSRRVSAPSSAMTTDFSLWRKSSASIVATLVFESADQAPIEWGCLRAKFFTDAGARRSELPFAQHGVHRAALDLVVAGAGVLLLRRRRLVGVVGDGDALALQLGDRGLELRHRGGDVGQLDDVGLGRRGQLAELGEGVALRLVGREPVGERGDDASGERDVAGLDLDAGGGRIRLDDREEGVRREERCLVGERVDDPGHAASYRYLDVKINGFPDPRWSLR